MPAGASPASAVLARWNYSAAVKSDGTVVAWGGNDAGQTAVPAGLSGVTAVAGNIDYCLALISDGSVVGWGNYPTPPIGLSGVRALAAGEGHALALLSNGTVVAWGDNSSGQINVPAGLANVSAITAGWNYSIALSGSGPAAGFVLSNPALTANGFTVSLSCASGISYTLQYKNSLKDIGWTSAQTVAGTGGPLTLTDTTASQTQRFYRVLSQ